MAELDSLGLDRCVTVVCRLESTCPRATTHKPPSPLRGDPACPLAATTVTKSGDSHVRTKLRKVLKFPAELPMDVSDDTLPAGMPSHTSELETTDYE